jgi:RNA polymerase sigma-70 factor (ECF subfamily)
VELRESVVESPVADGHDSSQSSPNTARMLEAIESLPEDERETFCLVRVQGMTQVDAAAVLGASVKTVQRRLARALPLLAAQLRDLQPQISSDEDAGAARS